jgi:cellulose synthase/poly-beta-1,6-N-acetylglucosamine synthase-like glycosyltransferase
MNRLGSAMWGSLALIAWTHAGYPVAAAAAASRSRYRSRADDAHLPTVALVIAAHDEERVIGERLDNALALDYPGLEIVVSLDGSTDGTREVVAGYAGVTLIDNPREGKVPAQNAAVRATSSEIVAFSDANSMWEPDALRRLVRHFADPEVGYVCGRLRLIEPGTGRNVEGVYWRYELWLRALESRLGSITAGNGAIYAVRRDAYVELAPGQSHDIGLPFRLRRAGLRSLYEPEAVASELAAPTTSAEWDRKVRMLSRSWADVLQGGMLDPRDQPPRYFAELISHRLLRYATGPLHLVLLLAALALATTTRSARAVVAGHALWLGLALAARRSPGRSQAADFAWYYLVVTAASLAGLARMATRGPQATWEGTR